MAGRSVATNQHQQHKHNGVTINKAINAARYVAMAIAIGAVVAVAIIASNISAGDIY